MADRLLARHRAERRRPEIVDLGAGIIGHGQLEAIEPDPESYEQGRLDGRAKRDAEVRRVLQTAVHEHLSVHAQVALAMAADALGIDLDG